MDNPNITMEEYIRLQEEKALSQGETFNWQTATYGKTEYCDDEDDCFTNFESEFPAIVFDNTITPREALSWEPTVSPLNDNKLTLEYHLTNPTTKITRPQHIDEFNNEISLLECDEKEQKVLYFNDLLPFNVIYPDDLKSDTDNDNDKINIEQPSGDMSVIPSPNVINADTQRNHMAYLKDLAETMIWYNLKKTCVELIRAF
ncbi:hypothetical protein Tco_0309593 [Tanacetum coccineum]